MPHDTDPSPVHPDPNNPTPPPAQHPEPAAHAEPPEAVPVADAEEVLEATPADAFSFDDPVPNADPEAFTTGVAQADIPGLSDILARAREAEELPTAEPLSGVDLGGHPANLEPLSPVAPASGWLGTGELPALPYESIPPAAAAGSSDIFGGNVPSALAADQSDVLAATAYSPAESRTHRPSDAPRHGSDVALAFDEPPGGSTVQDMGADEDLPFAEELPEGTSKTLVTGEGGKTDSSNLAEALDLPTAHLDLRDDEIDTGLDPIGPDASSILSDLTADEEASSDSSAIRLEAPGVKPTSQPSGGGFDLTVDDRPPSGAGPGSDLFAEAKAEEFDLTDDANISPFDPDLKADQPSLGSAQSSIFTGLKPPADASGLSGLPLAPAEEDAVDFSDQPKDPDGSTILRGDAVPDAGNVAWADAAVEDDPVAGLGTPGPLSGVQSRGPQPAAQTPERSTDNLRGPGLPGKDKPAGKGKAPAKLSARSAAEDENLDDPSVVLDYVAGTSEMSVPGLFKGPGSGRAGRGKPGAKKKSEPVIEADEEVTRTRKAKPLPGERAKGGKSGALVGWVGGLVVGAGAFAGLYFGGVLPNGSGTAGTQTPPINKAILDRDKGGVKIIPPGAAVADAKTLLEAGDPAAALKAIEAGGAADGAEAKANRGQARFLTRVRELARDNQAAAADDAGLKQARDDLQAAAADPAGGEPAARATLFLGLTHETSGDRAGAKKVYEDGLKKFPQSADVFQAALDRLDATAPAAGKSSRLTPRDAEQLAAAAALLLVANPVPEAQQPEAAPPAEAGAHFWKAVNAAAAGKYADAVAAIDKAKEAHAKRAAALAGRGLNPTTDPLEQIFPRCCDDLKAYWTLRKTLYESPSLKDVAAKGDLGKAVVDRLAQAEKQATTAVTLAADLKMATDKLKTAEAEAKAKADEVLKVEKDLKTEKEAVVKLEKDVKAATDDVKKLQKDEVDLKDKLAAEETARKKSEAVVGSVAKELQGAKLLPEKYDDAALIAAQKEAANRASGPNLTTLLPAGSAAVGGTGLAAGQLVDLAQRVTTSEKAAKDAADRLAADTKKLSDEHATKVKDLADRHAADLKKAADAGTKAADDLKTKHADEVKKLADAHAADVKKLKDAAAVQEAEMKALAASEKTRFDAMAKKFEADLGNAVSPSAALDLRLELLVGLRRPADADAAIAAARKVLATAPEGSEDAAKAHAVVGVAELVKGNTAEAGRELGVARKSAGFKAAGDKPWAKAAETAAAAVIDPLAPVRRPVTERKDPDLALRQYDAGVSAYRAGRFADAEAVLTKAAFNDPTDARIWYFLGAARWQLGKPDEAREDFKQGGEREKGRSVSSRAITQSLTPIQGAFRGELDAARP